MSLLAAAASIALCAFASPMAAAQTLGVPNYATINFPKQAPDKPRMIEFSFRNNAEGPVGFELEATVEGAPLSPDVLGQATCVTGNAYGCDLLPWVLSDGVAQPFVASFGTTQGIWISGVILGAKYCMRVNVFSEADPETPNWSKRTCVTAPPAPLAPMDALAADGALIAWDALANELRRRQRGDNLRGFNIGLKVAEADTLPGPGKKRIHDELPPEQRDGYNTAVSYSLQRNNNAENAKLGAHVISLDAGAAQERALIDDVFYWLGFDIATAIFGDRKLGAAGNTEPGPGSARIHATLDRAAQKGFEAAQAFHRFRNVYPRRP